MLGNWPVPELPNLTDVNCELTSPATPRYNCIAWAAKESHRWWWPDPFDIYYWPDPPVAREVNMQAFVDAYQTLGFSICMQGSLENGVEKIALYGIAVQGGDVVPTHAALQLPSGLWTSKLGQAEDITHLTVDDLNGPIYGRALIFMSKPRS